MKSRWWYATFAMFPLSTALPASTDEGIEGLPDITELDAMAQDIMRYHEKVVGIAYPESRVRFGFSNTMLAKNSNTAIYVYRFQTIWFAERFEVCDFAFIRTHLFDQTIPEKGGCDGNEFRNALSHELAHWLMHTIIIHSASHSWLKKYFFEEDVPSGLKAFNARLVIEGMGEYYGRLFPVFEGKLFSENYWEKKLTLDDFWSKMVKEWYLYDGGYNVVKGIFDARGPKEGLSWILQNGFEGFPDVKKALEYKRQGMNLAKT